MQAPLAFWACKANFFTLEVFHLTRRGLIVCSEIASDLGNGPRSCTVFDMLNF